jgi:hypothetical protein
MENGETPSGGPSNTIFCGNCYSEESVIREFFEKIGKVLVVRTTLDEGGR